MPNTELTGEVTLSGDSLNSAILSLRELLATPLPTKPTRLRLLEGPLAILLQIARAAITTPEPENLP